MQESFTEATVYIEQALQNMDTITVAGDTVSNVTKPAKVETGITVQVPIFVNVGDKIKVDTRSRSYLGRE